MVEVTLLDCDNSLMTIQFNNAQEELVVLKDVPSSLHENVKYWAEWSKRCRWDIYRAACQAYGNSAEAVERYMSENFSA